MMGHLDICFSNMRRCQHIVEVAVSLNDARLTSKQRAAYRVFYNVFNHQL